MVLGRFLASTPETSLKCLHEVGCANALIPWAMVTRMFAAGIKDVLCDTWNCVEGEKEDSRTVNFL